MQKFLNIFLVTLVSLYSLSCEHESDSNSESFESLVIEYNFSTNKYELNKKPIYSLDEPRNLNSDVAKFFYKIDSNLKLDHETTVTLNLIKTSDDLFVPKDLSSLKSLSSYKIYEDYYNSHNKLGILSYSVWPKKVVVDAVDEEIGSNNAFHVPPNTSTFYLPFDPYNVPASLNPGVIAHEENHGLFYTQVVKYSIPEARYIEISALLSINYREYYAKRLRALYGPNLNVVEYNHMLLRALDEGLADYSGFVFSNVPNFLTVTLGYESERGVFNRVVSNSLSDPLPSIDQLQAIIDNIKGESNINSSKVTTKYLSKSNTLATLGGLSYTLAGQISSLLNILSQNIDYTDMPVSLSKNEYFFKLIIESLHRLEDVFADGYENRRISFDDFFKAVLKNKIITDKTCKILKANVSEEITLEGCKSE